MDNYNRYIYAQVPQVTEEIAISVLDLYPTIISLAHAYSLLVSSYFLSVDFVNRISDDPKSEFRCSSDIFLVCTNNSEI